MIVKWVDWEGGRYGSIGRQIFPTHLLIQFILTTINYPLSKNNFTL